jgi:hypothetical protein
MLKDPKMQDMMSAVMGGGPDMMKKYLSDPDAMLLLQKLSTNSGDFGTSAISVLSGRMIHHHRLSS